jgi:predicted DNA-binding transcriptional regulator YafY
MRFDMENKTNKKGRLLYLLKFLYENTDEDNPVSTNEIIAYFAARDISVNRKTVKDDMDILVETGFDIVTVKSSFNSFFWGSRKFQIPELKLLIDAVNSSKFITRDKSDELIQKLTSLASKNQSAQLMRHLFTTERVKPNNEQIYYIVDTITDAINSRKKIQFQYMEYTSEKKKVLRNKGELYINDPYALLWNEDHYYLMGFSEKHDKIVQFRVDRMFKPKVTNADAIPAPVGFNMAEYARKVFNMYDGDEVTVDLECDNALMKVIIDRFSEDVDTRKYSDTTFKARVNVCVSQTFYGWVFQFSRQIKIISPLSVKEEYQKLVHSALEE